MARAPEFDDAQQQDGKVPETAARQGVSHHGVRYVLGISLLLVILALLATYVLTR